MPTSSQLKLAAAATIVVLAVGYFLGWWSQLVAWLESLWSLLADSTLVPNWLLGLFAICAIIVAGMLGTSLRPVREHRRPSPIRAYDTFFNMQWRWSYDASGNVQNPTPHCLRCGHPLVLKDIGRNSPADRYECRCDRCGALACEIDCSIEELESRVLRNIHRANG
jgi:hypothetical protein